MATTFRVLGLIAKNRSIQILTGGTGRSNEIHFTDSNVEPTEDILIRTVLGILVKLKPEIGVFGSKRIEQLRDHALRNPYEHKVSDGTAIFLWAILYNLEYGYFNKLVEESRIDLVLKGISNIDMLIERHVKDLESEAEIGDFSDALNAAMINLNISRD